MEEKKFNVIKVLFRGFSFKQIQLARDVWQISEGADISFEEFNDYIHTEIAKIKESEEHLKENIVKSIIEWESKTRKCPECGYPLMLDKIRIPKGKSNIEGWNSLWTCPNKDCTFEEYSKELAEELYDKIMDGMYNADN